MEVTLWPLFVFAGLMVLAILYGEWARWARKQGDRESQ